MYRPHPRHYQQSQEPQVIALAVAKPQALPWIELSVLAMAALSFAALALV